jgi:hypothetical protein
LPDVALSRGADCQGQLIQKDPLWDVVGSTNPQRLLASSQRAACLDAPRLPGCTEVEWLGGGYLEQDSKKRLRNGVRLQGTCARHFLTLF